MSDRRRTLEPREFLGSFLGMRVEVALKVGDLVQGGFKSFDEHLHLKLGEARKSKEATTASGSKPRKSGEAMSCLCRLRKFEPEDRQRKLAWSTVWVQDKGRIRRRRANLECQY